jgi:eukaryotic-like serine/threonine-protein kinase
VREDPLPPSDSNRDVPPDIDAVVLKALAKNRMNRYQSAGEMRGDLLRAASGRPVLATPVMRPEERVPPTPPPPRVVGNRNTGAYPRVPQRRQSSPWLLITLVVLGFVALGALGTGLYLANKTPQSTVPSIQGLKQTDANSLLTQAKLTGAPSPVFDANCVKDTVTHQDTPPGRKITQGSSVSYEVCGGPKSVAVPQLMGKDQQQAAAALSQALLKATFTDADSLVKDKGKVVGVQPGENTQVAQGSTVTVALGRGNQAVVPDLSGLSQDAAQQKLTDAGFTAHASFIQRFTDDPTQVGKVTGQDPSANATKPVTTTIIVYIGKAQPTSPTPSTSASAGTGGG